MPVESGGQGTIGSIPQAGQIVVGENSQQTLLRNNKLRSS
jgi:hypothetical protein